VIAYQLGEQHTALRRALTAVGIDDDVQG